MDRLKPGISEHELKVIENREIIEAASVDRDWWSDPTKRFSSIEQRDKAIKDGNLIKVDIPNKYFTSPSEIRNNENLQLLRPEAKLFLERVCEELDKVTNFSQAGIRLAVTSMYRSQEDQNNILNNEGWYRATNTGVSSHGAGAAFDISIRSHYITESETNRLIAVNNWNETSAEKYQPIIFEKLGDILSRYSEKGVCNLIVENNINGDEYEPTCFHVCISPEVKNFFKNE